MLAAADVPSRRRRRRSRNRIVPSVARVYDCVRRRLTRLCTTCIPTDHFWSELQFLCEVATAMDIGIGRLGGWGMGGREIFHAARLATSRSRPVSRSIVGRGADVF